MQLLKLICLCFSFCFFQFCVAQSAPQPSTQTKELTPLDSLILSYKINEKYNFVKKVNISKQTKVYTIDCFSGKSLLVFAVFKNKPIKAKGILFVCQKVKTKIFKDPFYFEEPHYNDQLKKYASSIKLIFPKEANSTNCFAEVAITDNDKLDNLLYFLVFTKK